MNHKGFARRRGHAQAWGHTLFRMGGHFSHNRSETELAPYGNCERPSLGPRSGNKLTHSANGGSVGHFRPEV